MLAYHPRSGLSQTVANTFVLCAAWCVLDTEDVVIGPNDARVVTRDDNCSDELRMSCQRAQNCTVQQAGLKLSRLKIRKLCGCHGPWCEMATVMTQPDCPAPVRAWEQVCRTV